MAEMTEGGRGGRGGLRRWWVVARYRWRGWADGRRGLPSVTDGRIDPTPTLHRLEMDVRRARDAIQARRLHTTAPMSLELARLTQPGGVRDRAVERLAEMERRLAEALDEGIRDGRRYGEQGLPDELVASRRQHEFRRRVKQARKRVEDERTRVSDLEQRIAGLRRMVENADREAAAAERLEGRRQELLATAYLDGVLRSHAHRPLLNAVVPELTPAGSTRAAPVDASAS